MATATGTVPTITAPTSSASTDPPTSSSSPSQSPTSTSPTSNTTPSSSSPPASPSSSSSAVVSPTPTPSSSQSTVTRTTSTPSSSRSSSVVIVVTTVNGQTLTQTGTDMAEASNLASSQAAALNDANNNSGSSSNAKAWIIPLAVIGGLAVLGFIAFIVFKMSRGRFSDLDEDEEAPIKWPELRGSGSDDAILAPPRAARRVTGAGLDLGSEFGDDSSPRHSMVGVYPANATFTDSHASSASLPQVPYFDDPRQSYYDPYLGVAPLDGAPPSMSQRSSTQLGYASASVYDAPSSGLHTPPSETTTPPLAEHASDAHRSSSPPNMIGLGLERPLSVQSIEAPRHLGIANPDANANATS